MTETLSTECDRLLKEAITRLSRGEVESTISSITEARKKLAVGFSLTTIGQNQYSLARQVARHMQCAMLHYFALAKREQTRENNVRTLMYLGFALGINATLDSLLPHLMEKHSKMDYARNEILWFSKINNMVREALCKSVRQVAGEIEGKKKPGF